MPHPEVVEAEHERDEEQGVERRTRAVAGGPLPDQGTEILEAEYQVEQEQGDAQDDVEQDVRVGGGRGDERRLIPLDELFQLFNRACFEVVNQR